MLKDKDIQSNLVVRIRRYNKIIPDHWKERAERQNHMGRLVTIKKIGEYTHAKYGKIQRYPIAEIWIKETSYPWYSDDFVKANKIR
jgi:hypothetical protein